MAVPKLSGKACSSFAPGQEFTFVTTTGTLSGEFANAPDGSEIPITFANECNTASQTIQIDYHESGGSIKTVTGIVEAAKKKQEEEAATKRKQEEEAASKKKQEEETANKKPAEEHAKKMDEEVAAAEAAATRSAKKNSRLLQ